MLFKRIISPFKKTFSESSEILEKKTPMIYIEKRGQILHFSIKNHRKYDKNADGARPDL